ncbi:ribonuclease III [Phenylobacterium aquaticum]|uniref:ribonuclease III n=1 Tax=Phenylobacterium aquaticum TaxID=1763816 RepID=UPI0026E9FA86|nr:ribonuclease III [Phenylobacterium aquaticum]
MSKRDAAVAELEGRIGHVFADRELLERALTHSSVGNGATKVRHNERLEFLGDRVLNLIVAERLAELRPEAREGELSRLMNQLVNYHVCAVAARLVGLPDAMRVDASATKVGARDNDRVLGDACEAVIAALYLDGGLQVAKAFVLTFWSEAFGELDAPRLKDSKTLLQEWAMARGLPVPSYDVIATTGPAHQPRFTIEVRLQGFEPERAEGGSKREAEKIAADLMLRKREDAL